MTDLEDFGTLDDDEFDEGFGTQTFIEDTPYPLQDLDQDVFDAEWVASIEALDSISDHMLYAGSGTTVPVDWEQDQAAMTQTLSAIGLDSRRLVHQQGEELSLVLQLGEHLGLVLTEPQAEWHRRQMVKLVEAALNSQEFSKRLRGEHLAPSAQRLRDGLEVAARTIQIDPLGKGRDANQEPPPGTRLQIIARRSAPPGTREEQEAREQSFWAEKVVAILTAAKAPLIDLAKESMDPAAILRGAIGSTRGSTMECYTKAVQPMLEWVAAIHKVEWPTTVISLVDFVHVAGGRPCSPSFPKKLLQAISWFERIGNWDEGERLCGAELVIRTVDFWTEELRAGIKPLKKAPRYTWVMMASLELFVMDEGKTKALRFRAWTMLVKAWGTMRQDDIQHLSPGRLRQMGESLIAEIMRSKTSGASKRVRELPVSLWLGATLTKSLWWEAGLGLLDELTVKSSDFLLPAFSKHGIPIQRPQTYIEAASMARMVLSDLQVPRFDQSANAWKLRPEKLLPGALVAMWTEHSGRPVLPSSAQLLSFTKEEVDFLGRWSPGGSGDYTRAFRQATQSIQQRIWKAAVSGDVRLYEFEVLDRVNSWADEQGLDSLQADSLRQALEAGLKGFWAEIGRAKVDEEIEVVIATVPPPRLAEAPLAAVQKDTAPPKFIIVYGRDRKKAKLHKVGGCQWTRVTLADSKEMSNPLPHMYSSRCKLCWPTLAEQQMKIEFADASEESDW